MSRMHFFSRRSLSSGSLEETPRLRLVALEQFLERMEETPAMKGDVRLMIEALPATGPWNMAVDEALLESVAAGAPSTLRLYRWAEPTISVGYFQRETPEIAPGGRFHGLAAVRRLSGGGAILHHKEVTYSCCVPAEHPLVEQPAELYNRIHHQIQATLARFGAQVSPRGETEGSDKTFLCFARGDRRDLVCQGFKVVGSAQRRRQGAILQHGSVLLRRSPFLPEFPGIRDLTNMGVHEFTLMEQLGQSIASILGDAPEPAHLTREELSTAEIFERDRYRSLLAAVPATR